VPITQKKLREDIGATCTFIPLDAREAHATVGSADAVNKRRLQSIADSNSPLRLEFGERFVACLHKGKIITADVRRFCNSIASATSLAEWKRSDTQSLLACEDAKDFFSLVLRQHWKGSDRFALRMLSDTLHFRADDEDGKTVVTELRCQECDVVDNVQHICDCDCQTAMDINNATVSKLLQIARTGDYKPSFDNAMSMNEFLFVISAGEADVKTRCGLISTGDWKRFAGNIWNSTDGVPMPQVFRSVVKLLYESVFEIWCSRHDWHDV
jgi:hypothetical protein